MNVEAEKTFEMRIDHIRAEWESKYSQKCDDFDQLLLSKNNFEEKLRDLKGEFRQLEDKNTKLSQDNYRMKYILIGNNKQLDALKQDVEYFKYRVKEMSDISKEDEDTIKKVIKKNTPKNKQTDSQDLQQYINGEKIEAYNKEKSTLNEKEREKEEELIKQKKRKFPVSLPTQTDPPQGVDFGIQIKNGEEIIPFVDYRPQSAHLKAIQREDMNKYSDFCDKKKVPLKKSNSITNVIDYSTKKDTFGKEKNDIESGKVPQIEVKLLSNIFYHKIVIQKFLT